MNIFLQKSLHFAIAVGCMMVMNGCSGCFKNGANREARVANCSELNGKQDACNATMQTDAKRCEYNKTSNTCAANPDLPPTDCSKLSFNECKASKFCTFKDTINACGEADPALKGKCEVIQMQDFCNADTKCEWNQTAVVCQQKVN